MEDIPDEGEKDRTSRFYSVSDCGNPARPPIARASSAPASTAIPSPLGSASATANAVPTVLAMDMKTPGKMTVPQRVSSEPSRPSRIERWTHNPYPKAALEVPLPPSLSKSTKEQVKPTVGDRDQYPKDLLRTCMAKMDESIRVDPRSMRRFVPLPRVVNTPWVSDENLYEVACGLFSLLGVRAGAYATALLISGAGTDAPERRPSQITQTDILMALAEEFSI